MAEDFAARLSEAALAQGHEVSRGDDPEGAVDVVAAVGGDGTVLAAVQTSLRLDAPVLGFNLGTIGFLAEAEPGDLEHVIASLGAGQYTVGERMALTAQTRAGTATGLNDVVVEKVDSSRLISLEVAIDDEHFTTYRADGLIVATPTGSTAYNFSAQGPLADPGLDALILTPVATHSLFDRSVVLSPESKVTISVSLDRPVKVTVDKIAMGELQRGESVTITRAPGPVRFVVLRQRSFASRIKDKFRLA